MAAAGDRPNEVAGRAGAAPPSDALDLSRHDTFGPRPNDTLPPAKPNEPSLHNPAALRVGINHLELNMPTAEGGTEVRAFDAYVPKGYDPNKPVPTVMMLDGARPSWDNGNIEITSGMDRVADKLNFIALYPHDDLHPKQTHVLPAGLNLRYFVPPGTAAESAKSQDLFEAGSNFVGKWLTKPADWVLGKLGYPQPPRDVQGFPKEDETRDERFLKAITDDFPQLANVDRSKMYIAGFSLGGEFAQAQAAYEPHTYAGIGSIHGTLLGYEQKPQVGDGTAYFGIVSKPDSVLPMNGGGKMPFLLEQPGYSRPLNQVPRWTEVNGCTGAPKVTTAANGDTTTQYLPAQCATGDGVEQIVRENGLHAVDGTTADPGLPVIGVPDRHFEAVETMMDYLLQFKRQ